MDSSRDDHSTAGFPQERRRRRQTTTLRLLDCLVSFGENVEPSVRGTEDDPHLSFVTALQHSFRDRTKKIEFESKVGKGVSIPSLLTRISSDSSKAITANDLAQMITRGSGENLPNPREAELLSRRATLLTSETLMAQAKGLSLEGRELHLAGKADEAKSRFDEADDLFREAVLALRLADDPGHN